MRSVSVRESAASSVVSAPMSSSRALTARAAAVASSGSPQRRAPDVTGGSADRSASTVAAAARSAVSRSRTSAAATVAVADEVGRPRWAPSTEQSRSSAGRFVRRLCRPRPGTQGARGDGVQPRLGDQHDIGDVQAEVGEVDRPALASSTSSRPQGRTRLRAALRSAGSAVANGEAGSPRRRTAARRAPWCGPWRPGVACGAAGVPGGTESRGRLHRLLGLRAPAGDDVVDGVGDEQVAVGVENLPQVVERSDLGGEAGAGSASRTAQPVADPPAGLLRSRRESAGAESGQRPGRRPGVRSRGRAPRSGGCRAVRRRRAVRPAGPGRSGR